MNKIVLAGGCFWGVEAYFKKQPYTINTTVGYANSNMENPDYKLVCTGVTNAAEALLLEYDGALESVLKTFFHIIDPTVFNRQGPDVGSQYRTGIYYIEEKDKEVIENFALEEQKKYKEKIVTEVSKLKNFYDAEEYHQDYLDKNPGGYCHIDLNS